MIRVIGVDLGTRRLAAACPEFFFVWSTSLDNARGRRQFPSEFEAGKELGRQLVVALLGHGINTGEQLVFFAERPFLRTKRPNVQTAVGMSLSAGAALSQLPGDQVLLRHPSLWKKAFCGNGNADKDTIRAAVEAGEPALAALCGEDQDRFDAVGIALGGARLASDGGV